MALLVILAVGLILIVSRKGQAAAVQTMNLDRIYQSVAAQFGEDWRLMKAFAIKESSENPNATNAGDPSYGLFGIQSFWLVTFDVLDKNDPDREARAKELLSDPTFAAEIFCRILDYFRTRTNPHTLDNFQFPDEADIYNVGETLWAKGVRNEAYRDSIVGKYQELTRAIDAP